MIKTTRNLVIALLLNCVAAAAADESGAAESPEILAKRGKGVVTHDQFDVRVSRIPEHHRQQVLRDRARLQDIINKMLLSAQLVEDAREAGFQEDPGVQARMALAAQEELGKAWLQHYAEGRGEADYEAMAREYYQVKPERFQTDKTLDLTHILVGVEERTEEEALELAQSLHRQIVDNPALFDELVMKHSDDPSASGNRGRFMNVARGKMVKPFEKAAFGLAAGQISEPVRTVYGYHIIRLDEIHAPRQQTFEEVRYALVERMRSRHQEEVRDDYISHLNHQDVEMTPEALEAMAARHFDDELLEGEPDGGDSE